MPQDAMNRVEVNGTRLAVRVEGSGPPVVLVHGSASDHRSWDGQLAAFAARHRTVVYSRRHHRPNPHIGPDEVYDFEAHRSDLAAVVETMTTPPAAIVGHSYGAVVALALALSRPELVGTLVLIEPPCFTLFTSDPPRPGELLRLIAMRPGLGLALLRFGATGIVPAQRAARAGDMERAMAVFGPAVLGRAAFDRLGKARQAQAQENLAASELIGPGFPRIDREAVCRLFCPALVLRGRDSPPIFRGLAEALAGLLPQAELRDVDGASHIVHEDATDAFNALALDFLEGSGGAARRFH